MSANKFKVGDKVRVRKNLIEGRQYGRIYCNADMAGLGLSGKTFTISGVDISAYRLENYGFWWSDEMLEPAKKTLDSLCVGDFVKNYNGTKKVLAKLDSCYLLSNVEDYTTANTWYTTDELEKTGYRFIEPPTPEPTIEIDGNNYKKDDIERAIKDLEVVD